MSTFLRLVDDNIIDFFGQEAEGFRYGIHELLNDSPYLLRHRYLDRLLGNFPENLTDCLIIGEPFCRGEEIVLDSAYSGRCYLGNKSPALALAEPKIGLAVLEDNFQAPSAGIYFPRLEKFQACVSGKKSVPFSVLGPACKKDPDRDTGNQDTPI